MQGTLYLCATPIGNLEDITFRVLRTLKEADLIAAEDTRNSIKLLNHFEIRTPMTSYHEYNKIEKGRELIEKLKAGSNIALITDAGTPGISDPGEELVCMARAEGITVTSLPGACACVTALTMSGLPTRRFAFEAFLPADKKECRRVLDELSKETRTIVLYEAPHRLKKTLALLLDGLGERCITVCRELTKKHEDSISGTITELLAYFEANEPKGEFVLILAGKPYEELEQEARKQWNEISIEEHVEKYITEGMSKKDAMKAAAVDRGLSKREVYQAMLGGKGAIDD